MSFAGFCGLSLFASGCSKNPKEKKLPQSLLYEKGMKKYETGDYEGALHYYQKAVEVDPRCDKAYLDLGILYEDYKGDIPRAMECYQKFLLLRPTGEKAEMVKGWLLKLAVNKKQPGSPILAPVGGAVAEVLTLVEVDQEKKKLEKQVSELQAELQEALQNLEKVQAALKEKETAFNEKLAQAEKTLEDLRRENKKSEQEKNAAQLELKEAQKNLTESAVLKRERLKWEEERKALEKKYQGELTQMQEEKNRLKQEKELALARIEENRLKSEAALKAATGQASAALENKGKTENEMAAQRSELDRLKGAFIKATEERTRLEKLIAAREEEIKNLKEEISHSSTRVRPAGPMVDRTSLMRQIAQLEQKVKALEDEKKRAIAEARREEKSQARAEPPAAVPVSNRPKKEYELVTYHRVKRGETLRMIAGYDHIYGDPSRWKIIYEANKDNIDDPNVLVPGQILLVPR